MFRAEAAVWYVVKVVPGKPTRDGKSWATAFANISNGIAAAQEGDEIWVAAGVYEERIQLKAGVALYGGFLGSEDARADRDWSQHRSTISASGTNLVHVDETATQSTRIDGFTIQYGSAYEGGGIFCSNASPVIVNNVFRNNRATNRGGGIYCSYSAALVQSNRFELNSAHRESFGGAIVAELCSGIVISQNHFLANQAGFGAAIYSGSSTGLVAGNLFELNVANNYGGAIADIRSELRIVNNRFDGNSAVVQGGAIDLYESKGRIAHNLFTRNLNQGMNSAAIHGFQLDNFEIVNNTLLWNTGSPAAGGALHLGSSLEVIVANNLIAFNTSGVRGDPVVRMRNNCVYGNVITNYSGMGDPTGSDGNISVDPQITGVNLFSGSGDHHLLPKSPCIGGSDISVVQAGELDMDGDARLVDGLVDIGADEFVIHPLAIQSDLISSSDNLRLTAVGQSGVPYTWERSTDLTTWLQIQTQATREGVVRIEEGTEEPIATYRVVSE